MENQRIGFIGFGEVGRTFAQEMKLRGADLLKMGFRPGPLYRDIFSAVMKARLNDEVTTKEDEINYIKENFKGMS